jgi:hypothetical protein
MYTERRTRQARKSLRSHQTTEKAARSGLICLNFSCRHWPAERGHVAASSPNACRDIASPRLPANRSGTEKPPRARFPEEGENPRGGGRPQRRAIRCD